MRAKCKPGGSWERQQLRQYCPNIVAAAVTRAVFALLLAAPHLLAQGTEGVAAAAAAAGGASSAGAAADSNTDHNCPQYSGSILDLPETADCRRLVRLLTPCLPSWQAATVTVDPGSACCQHAATFFSLQCHCWSSQFDGAVIAGVGAVDDACNPGTAVTQPNATSEGSSQQAKQQEQQQQQQVQQQHVGSGLGGLRSRILGSGSSQQQAIVLRTAADVQAATAAEASARYGGIRLYVGVLSASSKRAAREAIRATWGAHPAAYRTRFFLARPANDTLFEELRAEAVQKRDMVVVGHVIEDYANITHQTLEVLRLAAADPLVTHVLKTDDDSYIHYHRLMHRLPSLPRERLFWGHIENPGGQPHREPNHPWYVSREEWPSERYPPWAHGAGYVLTADLAAEVASGTAFAASTGGHLFRLEDIALGGWLEWAAQRGGYTITLVRDKRFNFGGCRYGDIVSHYIRPQQQLCMWAQEGRCRGC